MFFEGVTTHEQVAAIMARFGDAVPLVHNLLEGGGTPFADATAAGAAGFALGLFPATGLGAAAAGLKAAYRAIVADGSSVRLADDLVDIGGLNALVGTVDIAARIAAYGAEA